MCSISESEQDYLRAIYALAKRVEDGKVGTVALAERLGFPLHPSPIW